jgi:ADP-L-glycero-D-manno-heptose 6-epimerase
MIVITGGAGFIGSSLLHYFNTQGRKDIVIVDHLGQDEKWKNLLGTSFVDYFDKKTFLKNILSDTFPYDIEILYHLGACSCTTENDSAYLMENNTKYSQNLAENSLEKGYRFVYASSAATYGDGRKGYDDDNLDRLDTYRPLNMYGYSKHLFDLMARDRGYFDSITGFKFFNVYGPREAHKGDMRSLLLKAYPTVKAGASMKLFKSYRQDYNHGEQQRDFIHVDDVVRVLAWALNTPKATGLFNLGRGEAVSWNRLAKSLFKACRKDENIEYIDMPETLRDQYQYHTCACMDRLRKFGYREDFLDIESGVEKYVRWLENEAPSSLEISC